MTYIKPDAALGGNVNISWVFESSTNGLEHIYLFNLILEISTQNRLEVMISI